MKNVKKVILSIVMAAGLTAGSAWGAGEQVADYTAYPPFLPRVVSPNILFMLDYSSSMIRPAYGSCSSISNAPATISHASCQNSTNSNCLSNCRTDFSNISYDYDSSTTYTGYFNNTDKYTCSAGSNCSIDNTTGTWNGNFLNWLAMSQFDIVKKVTVGGDITPAPENPNPQNMKLQSVLGSTIVARATKQMNLAASTAGGATWTSCTSTDSPDCTSTAPTGTSTASGWPTLTYNWIDTSDGTTIFGPAAGDASDIDDSSRSATLPFAFSFYGNTYTTVYISTNGYIGFTNSNMSAYSNQNMPDATAGYPTNIIAPFWDDLYIRIGGMAGDNISKIMIKTVGSAPNRIFVVSFDPVYHISDAGKVDPFRFQILLYEGSNHIVFQYKDVRPGSAQFFRAGRSATTGVENSSGDIAKRYSYCSACTSDMLTDSSAIFATPHISYKVTPGGGTSNRTLFQSAQPLLPSADRPTASGPYKAGNNNYNVYIAVTEVASGGYKSTCQNKSYDHPTEGLLQDFRDGELGGVLGFRLGLMTLNSDTASGQSWGGGTVRKHFNEKDTAGCTDTTNPRGWARFMNDTRGQLPTTNTPLAEALYEAEGYFRENTSYRFTANDWSDSSSYDPYYFSSANQMVSCCKSFALIVSSGNYSNDNGVNIYDTSTNSETGRDAFLAAGWSSTDDASSEGTKANGGWLDNVAYKSHITDLRPSGLEGTQNLTIYPVNTFGSVQTNLSADIISSTTTISVNSTTGFSSAGKIQIGDEIISYTGKTATTFTGCTRGADSTTAASHSSGWKVYQAPVLDGAKILKKAAKYGGFDDSLGSNAGQYDSNVSLRCPDNVVRTVGEDDKNCDGDPDTYFEASGGSDLKAKIIDAVSDILKSSASGTTVSVLSTSASGEGAIYQAYFYPARVENQTDERTWPGFLRGFYLDKFQNLRDDSDTSKPAGAGSALVMKKDKIVRMRLDTASNTVKVDRFKDTNGDGDSADSGEGAADDPATTDMDGVTTIWEGGKKLAMRAKSEREIYAWVDKDRDGLMESGDTTFDTSDETLLFTTGNKDTLKPYLCAGNAACLASGDEAEKIVKFIRGEPVSGYRNRCISVVTGDVNDESGCEDTNTDKQRSWALGDIVYSTPTLVSGPGEKFDEIYGDSTYRSFRAKYAGRRSVIYTGANDGMLHAFNGGVYRLGDSSDTTEDVESGWFATNSSAGLNGFANGWSPSTGLGDELWAFISHDNLPHLAWLACNGTGTDPAVCGSAEYTHVYYVDQRPKVTDARIFSDDATHPGGWGTVLIMGMRLGGGAMDVDVNGDSSVTGSEMFRSALYAFDITDPEQPPKLLWRFYDPGLGFTTSYPAVVRLGPSDEAGKWYMIVGSGPKNDTGTNNRDYGGSSTTQAGKVFVVDLADGSLDRTFTVEPSNTFMGDPISVDADLDFKTDVIYIGSAISTTSGKIYRIRTKEDTDPANWDNSVLYDPSPTQADADPDQGKDMGPLLVSPSISKDPYGNLWVFFGTGRLRSQTDMSNSDQQAFHAVKDGCWEKRDAAYTAKVASVTSDNKISGTADTTCPVIYTASNLLNVSSVKVQTATGASQVEGIGSSGVTYSGGTACTTTSTTGCSLLGTARSANGWFTNLTNPADPTPSEKVLSRSVVLGGLVMFTTYKPTSEVCSIFGDSTLYALYYESGTAYIKPVMPEGGTYTESGTEYVSKSLDLGKGMPTAVGVAIGETVSGFVQKSTGEIVRIETQPGLTVRSGTSGWREKTGGAGTSEIETIYKHIVK